MAIIMHKGGDNKLPVTLQAGDFLITGPSNENHFWISGTVICDAAVEMCVVAESIDSPGLYEAVSAVTTLTPGSREQFRYELPEGAIGRVRIENVTGGAAIVKLSAKTRVNL